MAHPPVQTSADQTPDELTDDGAPDVAMILPLDSWHRRHGARMVPFASYEMPVQYDGVMAEHLWTRHHAGLFDVSHMGQLVLTGAGADAALETVVPGDIAALKDGRVRYTLLLDEGGGILDDLMVTRRGEELYIVVNGATKWDDLAVLREALPDAITINHLDEDALLALQGPDAATALARFAPGVAELSFMQAARFELAGTSAWISRSGYTGEDGFEIAVPAEAVEAVADALMAQREVKPIGLGARDSLRLEAGLPLYGHDLDDRTTPVAADLAFAIGKRRREEGGFAGAERILAELAQGSVQRRVGLTIEGRQPVREGAAVLDAEGSTVGQVTSGGYAPSVEGPIAMAYVPTTLAEPGTTITLTQRGKLHRATVTPMPFVPHRYHRKAAS